MTSVIRVAMPAPLYRCFDYLPPIQEGPLPSVGARVRAPFGRRQLVGVVTAVGVAPDVSENRLKPIGSILDGDPLLPETICELLDWVGHYYHHPPGEVYATALPVLLRRGLPARRRQERYWRLTEAGVAAVGGVFSRAPRQRELMQRLADHPEGLVDAELRAGVSGATAVLRRLCAHGWVGACVAPRLADVQSQPGPPLHPEQQQALDAVPTGDFCVTLLQGVTGSGKTEVYLQLTKRALAAGRQVLVLVPEIGLTPQLVARFTARLGARPAVLHSGLTPEQRLDAWLAARAGAAEVVLGTRSAVFTPLPRLGLVIVDEEHDGSYKQQDGLRYGARDVAVRRAQLARVPILLGSATPALETLANAHSGRYRHSRLPRRATGATLPRLCLLDIRAQPVVEGLSESLLERLGTHLDAGGQALLFLNRRGFAPVLLCQDCGWIAPCRQCATGMTLHQGARRLRCHHCGAARGAPTACEDCHGARLLPIGEGTERVAAALRTRLPGVTVARFDRDTTARKGSLEELLRKVEEGAIQVLVGTQMLAKGHDFPDLSFVGVVNADHGLFASDFRVFEHMAQLVTQVSGRAGRGTRGGEVILQTRHPGHPLLRSLVRHGYEAFAQAALAERKAAALPPYGHLALVEAQAISALMPRSFLEAGVALAAARGHAGVEFWGPAPAPLERRAGRTRAHLMLHATTRRALHRLLDWWIPALATLPAAKRVRWSVDVDPQDLT